MTLVMDASAAIEAARSGPAPVVEKAETVLAPDLFIAEVANTSWKYYQHFGLPLAEAAMLLERSVGFIDVYVESGQLYQAAFALAVERRHPVYDLFYLVLARQRSAVLMTRDKKLARLAEQLAIPIA